MKKRFTLMMMVLCFLMSIPLKMMAETVTIHYIFSEEDWGEIWAYVYQKGGGAIGSNWHGTKCENIQTNDGKREATWTLDLGNNLASNACVVFNDGRENGAQYPSSGGWDVIDEASYNKEGIIPSSSEGSGSGTGGGGGSDTPVEWNTVTTNRLTDTEKPRVYTQGFYLAGNFFTFDEKDEINYDDAVFKFQQQKDQSINESARTAYDVYMVEIPASLTAKAQVMYVDANGNKTGIFGPGTANINKDTPATGQSTEWANITANESANLLDNTQNYWNFSTRNVSTNEYSDGLYEVYIAVDKNTHDPKMWRIKHQEKKRVAYFISDTPDATAMPLYDTYKENEEQFANKFFATVNLAANRSYYVISNYIYNNNKVDDAKDYGTIEGFWLNRIPSPTTNKLFLQGNGELDFTGNYPDNLIFPNGAPLKVTDKKYWGTQIVEYNPSRGNSDKSVFGFCGDLILKNPRAALTSVSLVGDAIPGTLNADKTWNYKSNVADMTYDETEQCYKATVVTTEDAYGKSKFRFVGNRDYKITWFENTNTDQHEMAKYPLDSESAPGHTADANDPNKVDYNEKCDPASDGYDSWNILWNRPAGRWTVRLYFYTTSDGNNPKTDYYYTITASRDMELYDITDIVYDSETNKQNIYNKGEYKFLRTWSAYKTWKISNKVDVFVVNNLAEGKSAVKLTLKKINKSDNTGNYHIIPANTGVILATKSAASEIAGAHFVARQNYTSYNKLVIPMEENGSEYVYEGTDNRLLPIYYSKVIPASDENNYNYFFAYYNARIATKNEEKYTASDYLLGFWISKGSKPYPGNSSYLPIAKEKAETMNLLGTSYDDFASDATGGSAKKVPGIIFDFANVGGTTGINEVVNQNSKLNDGKYYTLSGQQVEKPTAGGIYIHNGRKFVVK